MKAFGRQHIVFIAAGILTILVLSLGSVTYLNAVDYASTARGVDVYLVANTQQTTLGDFITADIVITNDQTPLNAMEAEVYFDPTLFAVVDFTFGSSLCNDLFVIDRVIDNETGHLHMSCGTLEPFTGNATVFGTITAVPLKEGVTELTFGEQTHVHVHDGLGTEIARDTYDTTIVITSGA